MKRCFVIMPIKGVGTAEHRHYRALFDNVIKPTASSFGYDVKRADDFQKVGSITKDIILPLAESDLVIADLTDLNCNVFYELGVRHVLRSTGTIMILDDRQTNIPFDITTYRVIKFRADIEGIGQLSTELRTFISQFEAGENDARDNLVHDQLPGLPLNVLASAGGSEEGRLRSEIQSLRKQLQTYADRYGNLRNDANKEDPRDIIRQALLEAEEGDVPSALVDRAERHARESNHKEFLQTVARIIDLKTTRPTPKALMRVMRAADNLDLSTVSEAILDHAHSLYPTNREVRLMQLQTFAHSEDPLRRKKARDEFALDLGIKVSNGEATIGRPLTAIDFDTFGIMLDAYHRDNLHVEASRLVTQLHELYPGKSIVLRNLARANEELGNDGEALSYFIAAAIASDADDTSAVWLGNELHNRERHVDAAEAYALSCIRDPDDGGNFSHLAEELSWAVMEVEVGQTAAGRQLPTELRSAPALRETVTAALSCERLNAATIERIRGACNRVEIDLDEIVAEVQNGGGMSRSVRRNVAQSIRLKIGIDLTAPKSKSDVAG